MLIDSFNWNRSERQSDRYGGFIVSPDDANTAKEKFAGKRCRIVAVVREVKACEHIGDLFHGFMHTSPEVGERVVLGVGLVDVECDQVICRPEIERECFWLDPWALYRCHSQEVEILFEEVSEPTTVETDLWLLNGSKVEPPEFIRKLMSERGSQ